MLNLAGFPLEKAYRLLECRQIPFKLTFTAPPDRKNTAAGCAYIIRQRMDAAGCLWLVAAKAPELKADTDRNAVPQDRDPL